MVNMLVRRSDSRSDRSDSPKVRSDPPPVGRGQTPGSDLLTLPDWLTDLRRRGAQITLTDGNPTVAQPTPGDTAQLARYRHALQVAAAGTHPRWWAWVSGRGEVAPTLDELPLVTPLDGSLDVPHACATCGGPCLTVDARALAWCHEHAGAP